MTEATSNMEERFRSLYEISAINSQSTDKQLDGIVKIATKIFDLDIGIISKVEGNEYTVLSCYHPEGQLQKDQVFDRGITYCDIVLSHNDLQAIVSMEESSFASHPCYEAFKLEAYIGVPLIVNGQVFGTLNFSSPKPRNVLFSEEDKRVLRIMGNWVSNILENEAKSIALKKREVQYSRLIERTKACLYIHDLQGNFLQVNHQMCQELGFDESELLGRNLRDVIFYAPSVDKYLIEIQSLGAAEGTFTFISKTGAVRYLSYKNTVEEDAIMGFSQDITQAVLTQQALKESETNLKEAQELAKVGSYSYDMEEDKITWTKAVFKIFDMDPAQGSPTLQEYFDLIHPDDIEYVSETLHRAMEKHQDFTLDYRIVINKQVKYLHSTGRSQVDKRGNPIQLIGTIQDVTERIKIQQELIKAKEEAEIAAKIKQEFLANMSHEIRTPMNAILGFARLALRGDLNNEQRDYVQAIYDSAETLLVVINDILDFSKIEAGKLPIVPIHFDLRKSLDAIKKLFSVKVEEKGVRLLFDTEAQLPEALIGDPVRINQILNNLVGNAIKFTDKGFVEVATRIISKEASSYLIEIVVQDTGIGISADKLDGIFGSFEQAEQDITRRFGGTGLGLAIVKKLVLLMHGDIWVESQEGFGSKFTVRLPLDLGDKQKVELEGIEVNSIQSNEELKGKRILLAEDNRNNQVLANKFLSDVGCEVTIANNGQEALSKVQEFDYDLILMDIQMPIMDGLEATEAIRKLDIPYRPIVAMTAHALKEEEDKYREVGMNDYISKPFKPDVLYGKIIRVLTSYHENDLSSPKETSGATAEPQTTEIDFSSFEAYADGDEEFMQSMMQVFMQDVPDYLKELEIALSIKDWKWLKQTAHTLKSSVFFLGMANTLALLSALEAIDPDTKVPEKVDEQCQQVMETCQKAVEEMKSRVK